MKLDRDDILTIGCSYKPVRGGIAQVLSIYDEYVFKRFDFIANSRLSGWRNFFVLLGALARFFWRLISNRRIKIVHIHTAVSLCFYRASIFLLFAKLLGRKVIIHAHGGAFKEFYRTNPRVISWLLNRADCIIVLSASWEHFFVDIAPRTLVRIIPNPVVFPTEEELANRSKSPLLRVLFLGLLSKSKGIYDLLEVLSEHRDYFSDKLVLDVGGNGDVLLFKRKVEELGLSDVVRFHGWLSGDAKKRALLEADLFLLPSYFEGVPMVILEAFAYGVAVVATCVGGIPDVVNEKNGILIHPGDRDELFAVLKNLCENPQQIVALQSASKAEAQKYSVQRVALSLENLYNELLEPFSDQRG